MDKVTGSPGASPGTPPARSNKLDWIGRPGHSPATICYRKKGLKTATRWLCIGHMTIHHSDVNMAGKRRPKTTGQKATTKHTITPRENSSQQPNGRGLLLKHYKNWTEHMRPLPLERVHRALPLHHRHGIRNLPWPRGK